MLRLFVALLPALYSALRSRRDLVVEILALRQQLATLVSRRRPVLRPADRLFWILLRRLWSGWAESLAIVQPNTVVRWHRAGFRSYWNWLSRCGERSGRPPLSREVRALIRRMATENPWGAPRIHGAAPRPRGLRAQRLPLPAHPASLPESRADLDDLPPEPPKRHRRNGLLLGAHGDVPHLYVLFVIRHGRRDVARCAVTTSPTAAWVAQQLREAFPFDSAPRFLIFDLGCIFSAGVTATMRSMQMEPTQTVIVLNERHLRRLLESFIDYYGPDAPRTLQGLSVRASREVIVRLRPGGDVHSCAWRPERAPVSRSKPSALDSRPGCVPGSRAARQGAVPGREPEFAPPRH